MNWVAWVLVSLSTIIDPPAPRQGDMVVLRLYARRVTAVEAWFGHERVPFYQTALGWQGLIGIDLDAVPGPREVTGSVWQRERVQPLHARFRIRPGRFVVQQISLADDSKVNLAPSDVTRVVQEASEIRALFRQRTPRLWRGSFAHPLTTAPEGGRFGSRRFINGQPRNPHTGADYAAPKGEPVHAANDGVVALTAKHFFAGNAVFLDHGDGLFTMYFHLDQVFVSPGQRVQRGSVLGTVGATGRSSGPHLHFGVNLRGARVDPASLLRARLE